MFAKSERFTTTEKNDMPGPGQYNVNDLNGTHKRYGFLSQSGRFSEEHAEEDDASSTASHEWKKEVVNKNLQKEYDLLLCKSKKLEAALERMENEKKALQLTKEMELADVRSKNVHLQKTILRQEKQIKTDSWQKKQEQLKQDYEQRLAEKERERCMLGEQLARQTAELEDTRRAYDQERSQHWAYVQTADRIKAELQTTLEAHQARVRTLEQSLDTQRDQHQEALDRLEGTLGEIQDQATQQEVQLGQQRSLIDGLQAQFQAYRVYTQRLLTSSTHREELDRLLTELRLAKKWINTQGMHLQHLTSDIHWLTTQSQQQADLIQNMAQATLQHVGFFRLFLQKYIRF
ncbi:hypothetical protein BY458DRAFT_510241 [Sporodiniella umbellata]|nr:hypothetical protein BY458DRAFT_510241 [Sporodiniella umbellata]